MSESGGAIELRGLTKLFGTEPAVVDVNLSIRAGEFFSLLGPSGCGKTTTLRMVAGFEEPTSGEILLDGHDVAAVPAHKRRVNTVFQSYALFPHLSVEDNVAYGLRWQGKVGRAERQNRVGEALELVQLSAFAQRRPHQLSGGQQQRVALARALVLQPRVLLLDEPLGALDAKLRKTLRQELTTLHREVGVTFIFVTHDQEEALEMSDRLAVMELGRLIQCGSPRDVYAAPLTAYVADFLGVANLLEVTSVAPGPDGLRSVQLGDCQLFATPVDDTVGDRGHVVIRPERVRICHSDSTADNRLVGTIDRLVYVGATTQVLIQLANGANLQALVVNDSERDDLASGRQVTVALPPEALRLLSS